MEKCRRCLTDEMGELAYSTIQEYLTFIPPEKKTDDETYRQRLQICLECDDLVNGMCKKCGCFAEIRAAFARSYCPHERKRW